MEFGTKSKETSSTEPLRELSSSDKKKNKKDTGSAAIRAELDAEKSAKPEHRSSRDEPTPKAAEAAWHKLPDMPLFGIAKPDTKPNTKQAELADAAHEFTEVRMRASADELQELPHDKLDSPQAAEAAAGAALMRAVQERLQQNSDKPVAEVVDDAHQDVIELINQQPADFEARQGDFEADTEPPFGPPAPPAGPPGPPGPPSGPAAPAGAAGQGGNPRQPPNNGIPNFNTLPLPSPNVLPAAAAIAPNVLPAAQTAGNSLLAGGIVGYFIGRRRGRKQGAAKAEKKLAPTRKSLEGQVKQLQESIVSKEHQLRQAARDKFNAVAHGAERQKFVEKLLPVTAAKAEMPLPVAAVERTAIQAATTPEGQLYSRSETSAAPPAELLINDRYQESGPATDVGRLLVEAPVAAAAVPLAAVERMNSAERAPAKIIPFDKKAEQFSRQELMQTAEKITVQGVSLKEMSELGQLDEPALRRVTQEFLEGGNVSAAVAREVKEKELKFERDPRMRAARAGGSSAVAGAVGGGATGDAGLNDRQAASPAASGNGQQSAANLAGPRPTPDASTLKSIRDKQVATIAGTTVLIIIAIVILVLVTG